MDKLVISMCIDNRIDCIHNRRIDVKREFIFSDGKDINETIEDLSFKRAVKQFQGQHKIKYVWVKRKTKRGHEVETGLKLPIGKSR